MYKTIEMLKVGSMLTSLKNRYSTPQRGSSLLILASGNLRLFRIKSDSDLQKESKTFTTPTYDEADTHKSKNHNKTTFKKANSSSSREPISYRQEG